MGSNWNSKNADVDFVALAEAARQGEPQRVSIEGLGDVVIVDATGYDLMAKRPKTFVEHLLDFPKLPEGMDDIFDDRHLYQSEYRDIDFD